VIRRFLRVAVASTLAVGATAACSRPAPPRVHTVRIQNFTFVPAELTVSAGDTLVWSNTDFVPHSATARDASWDSHSVAANGTWRFVPRTTGRHEYYCVLHPNMTGAIVVR